MFQRTTTFLVGLIQHLAALGILCSSVQSANAQSSTSKQPGQGANQPDIVYILSDDQAYGDYSFMGHPHIRTPNLDQLARESRLFTRGYVPDSLCRPSLATIISGLYPHQHGITGNDPPPVGGWSSKSPRRYVDKQYQGQIEAYLKAHIDRIETLPDRLAALGYVSYQTGKWWEGNPSRGGFTKGMTHGDHSKGARHGDVGLEIGRKSMQPIADYIREARSSGKPYFLWYAPMLPHTPHDPPRDLLEKYKPLAPTEPIAKYWAMCERFDQTIGELRKLIAEHGRPDNTIIVYVTDNGWINLPDRSAYAPRSKRSPNEGGIRTPIMVAWPGHVTPGRDEEHLVSSIDLVPTTLALLGQAQPKELPGINVLDEAKLQQRKTLFGAIFEHDIVDMDNPATSLQYRWIIDGTTKMIVPAARTKEESVQIYDLKNDPNEMQPLTNVSQEQKTKLLDQLNAWWKGE